MKASLPIIASSLICVTEVSAWTQSQYFGNRLMSTVLRLREEDQVDIQRSRLEKLFSDVTNDYHDDTLPYVSRMDQMTNLPVHNWVESPEDVYSDWSDTSPCFGDECDQCEIPAEYKQEIVHDVLDFLGITRAEPLRIDKRRL
jgi:hypothetical protein